MPTTFARVSFLKAWFLLSFGFHPHSIDSCHVIILHLIAGKRDICLSYQIRFLLNGITQQPTNKLAN